MEKVSLSLEKSIEIYCSSCERKTVFIFSGFSGSPPTAYYYSCSCGEVAKESKPNIEYRPLRVSE